MPSAKPTEPSELKLGLLVAMDVISLGIADWSFGKHERWAKCFPTLWLFLSSCLLGERVGAKGAVWLPPPFGFPTYKTFLSQNKVLKNTWGISELSLLLLFLALLLSLLLRYHHDCAALLHRFGSTRSFWREVPPGRQEAPQQWAPGGAGQCPATSPSCRSTARWRGGEGA